MNILHALKCHFKLSFIIYVFNREHVTLIHIVIIFQRMHLILPQEFAHQWCLFTLLKMERLKNLVKDVKVSLDAMLKNYTRFLQQIVNNRCRMKNSCHIKVYLYEFTEAGRVVVFESFSISKSL